MTQRNTQETDIEPQGQSASSRGFAPAGQAERKPQSGCFRHLAGMLAVLIVFAAQAALADKPEIDVSYADGGVYYMIGPHMITNPSPNLVVQSEELYLLVYPLNPTGATNLGALTLPSGYQPNCDPCFHPGLPPQFAYHDHLLTGAPGLGNNGTAGEFKAPWKIIVMMYNPAIALRGDFQPIKSEADLDAAEASGEFLPLNPGAENPFELETGSVLICPFVSPAA